MITNQARDLSAAIVPLKTEVKAETDRGVKLETLDREIDLLEKLIQGFERISSGGANDRDLVASFRPIRAEHNEIDRELQAGEPRRGRTSAYGKRSSSKSATWN